MYRFLLLAAILGGAVATMAIDAVQQPACNPVPLQCVDGQPCDDWDACTTGDMCVQGECMGGPSLDCNDGNVCTTESCDPIEGCVYGSADCSDGVDCTIDSCDPVAGCVHDAAGCNTALRIDVNSAFAFVPVPWDARPFDTCVGSDVTIEGFAVAGILPPSAYEPTALYIASVPAMIGLYFDTLPGGATPRLVCEIPIATDIAAPVQTWYVDLESAGIDPTTEWHHYACEGTRNGIVQAILVDGVPLPVVLGDVVPSSAEPGIPALWVGAREIYSAGFDQSAWVDAVRLSSGWLYDPWAGAPAPPSRRLEVQIGVCGLWNFTAAPGSYQIPPEVGSSMIAGAAAVDVPGEPPLPYTP